LSTIARMDRLIVLDAGPIVEQGTHAELLALGPQGHYARLWSHQSGGFLLDDDEGDADAALGTSVPAVV
jgi:ABC-type transport system involved in cytochrome bd biosynthesis fused ATPase/permease subunit